MTFKFRFDERIIDDKKLGRFSKLLIKIHNLVLAGIEYALELLRRSKENDYPEKCKKIFFSKKNGNYIFNEFTYFPCLSWSQKMLTLHKRPIQIVYVNNIVIVIAKIRKELVSAILLEKMNRMLEKCTTVLKSDNKLPFINQRGYKVSLSNFSKNKIHQVILYDGSANTTSSHGDIKYLTSKDDSIIHLMNKEEYHQVINKLITPQETNHYLSFREWLCKRKSSAMAAASEISLLGQYLIDSKDDEPNNKYAIYAKNLDMELTRWEMLLASIHKSTLGKSKHFEQDYYFILSSIAKLRSDELILLRDTCMTHYKNIFNKHLTEKSEVNVLLPFGFVVIEHWQKDNEKAALKYEMIFNTYRYQRQLSYCIAVIFIPTKTSKNESNCEINWLVKGGVQLVDE